MEGLFPHNNTFFFACTTDYYYYDTNCLIAMLIAD